MCPKINEIAIGDEYFDHSLEINIKIQSKPRLVYGGYVVDVTSKFWNGSTLAWIAVVSNLRKLN